MRLQTSRSIRSQWRKKTNRKLERKPSLPEFKKMEVLFEDVRLLFDIQIVPASKEVMAVLAVQRWRALRTDLVSHGMSAGWDWTWFWRACGQVRGSHGRRSDSLWVPTEVGCLSGSEESTGPRLPGFHLWLCHLLALLLRSRHLSFQLSVTFLYKMEG